MTDEERAAFEARYGNDITSRSSADLIELVRYTLLKDCDEHQVDARQAQDIIALAEIERRLCAQEYRAGAGDLAGEISATLRGLRQFITDVAFASAIGARMPEARIQEAGGWVQTLESRVIAGAERAR